MCIKDIDQTEPKLDKVMVFRKYVSLSYLETLNRLVLVPEILFFPLRITVSCKIASNITNKGLKY